MSGVAPDVRDREAAALRALYGQRTELKHGEFATAHGLPSGAMVWQYLSGHRPLNLAAAARFAHGLVVPLSAFSPRLADELAEICRGANVPAPGSPLAVQERAAPYCTLDDATTQLGVRLARVPAHDRPTVASLLSGWALAGGADHYRRSLLTLLQGLPDKQPAAA